MQGLKDEAKEEKARDGAYELNNARYEAQEYVDGDCIRKRETLHRIACYGNEDQVIKIKELYFAVVRKERKRELFKALTDDREAKRHREIVKEAYREIVDPDCGEDFVYEWKPTDIEKFRDEVRANCAAADRQVELLAAATAGRKVYERKTRDEMDLPARAYADLPGLVPFPFPVDEEGFMVDKEGVE